MTLAFVVDNRMERCCGRTGLSKDHSANTNPKNISFTIKFSNPISVDELNINKLNVFIFVELFTFRGATEEVAIILQKADNGNSIGKVPCGRNIPESVGHAFCMTALTACLLYTSRCV